MINFTTQIQVTTDNKGELSIGPSVMWGDDGSVTAKGVRLKTIYCIPIPTPNGSWKPWPYRVTTEARDDN